MDLLVVGLPVALVAQTALHGPGTTAAESVGIAALLFCYDTALVALGGRTLGKRLAGVRVVSLRGNGVSLLASAARAAVFAVPIALRPVPVLGLVAGFCWVGGVALVLRADPATEQDRRTLHDRAAGTTVVRDS